MHHYSFHLFWSKEDEAYIATVLGFKGVSAHGETPQEALQEVMVALELVIEDYQEEGWDLPEPQVAASATP